VSGFYFNKKTNSWAPKLCSLILGYYIDNKWHECSKLTMNLDEMVNLGDIEKTYQFPAS